MSTGMEKLTERVRDTFRRQFDGDPVIIRSPGRINLIGEHTDYNAGFVLPSPIDRCLLFGIRRTQTGRGRFYAMDRQEGYETDLSEVLTKSSLEWPNYLLGVIDLMQRRQEGRDSFSGLDVVFSGNIPVGAGLSSSAALTSGVAFGLNRIFNLGYESRTLARIAQKAENGFVGVRCGVMDPFINLHGVGGKALKLDCRSLEYEPVPLGEDSIRIVICDSGIQRDLSTSEYNQRREQCEEGVTWLQSRGEAVQALRDADEAMLEKYRGEMDPLLHKRCLYVVRENRRVGEAAERLREGDMASLGSLMTETHAGLRDSYQVSCPEIDLLVERALETDGVLGSRMMGGGFGGSTISLVREEGVEKFKIRISQAYAEKYGKQPSVFTVRTASATEIVDC